jgi:hypothetical protein
MSVDAPALTVDELLGAATQKVGSDEFGDDWFLEPLGVLVDSLNTEAQLSELGVELTRRRLTALLFDRLRLRALQREHPEILEIEPDVGAVICGLPRTGSTLLHRLLSTSPRLTSTLSWETSYPIPFPGESGQAEERKRRARERMELFLELAPDFEDIHDVVWDGPEEDVILLDRTFTSMSFDSFYWIPSYGDWLRATDQRPAYEELRQWLQVLQWQDPARERQRWVLKSPHHLTAVATVLDVFDESRIVMTHRSPVQAVPSYASMVAAMSAQYSEAVDPGTLGPYWAERFATTLRAFGEVRQRRPDRFVDVRFEETVAEPVATASEVMNALGLPAADDDIAAFTSYVERDREERSASHAYTAADFGLTEDGLARDFAFYTEEYL